MFTFDPCKKIKQLFIAKTGLSSLSDDKDQSLSTERLDEPIYTIM